MTSEPYVVAAAMLPVGRYPGRSYVDLGAPVVGRVLADAALAPRDVQAVYCGHSFGGMLAGQRIAQAVGLGGVPVTNVENACSGGATALHEAQAAVRCGRHDVTLVVGVDQLSQFGGGTLPLNADDWEVQRGMVMPALYAMRARRFLHERGASVADLAEVAVKARAHGARNPYAQLRKPVSVEEVLASRTIATPLTLYQCCPSGDGAAALLVVSDRVRRRLGGRAVRVRASVLHSGTPRAGFRPMLRPDITVGSAREACEQAGIGPREFHCIELHDAFTVAELVYYEALGLCREGEAVGLLRSGATRLGGRTVVNPSGGLLAKGHPIGATGVAQVVEAYWQLTGRATGRQIDGARLALTHVTGGGITGVDHGACCVHVFEGTA